MRSLQHRQLGVAQKPTDGDLQEGACGDVVAIEDSDKLAAGYWRSALFRFPALAWECSVRAM